MGRANPRGDSIAGAAADSRVQSRKPDGAAAGDWQVHRLRQALLALRISIHNTVGIGDAENDHDLLDACEATRDVPPSATLREFVGLLATMPAERLIEHLRRHDFSRWLESVFRDLSLATHIHRLEGNVPRDAARDIADAIAQSIRARYETGGQELVSVAQPD
jgi:hypothetical protein